MKLAGSAASVIESLREEAGAQIEAVERSVAEELRRLQAAAEEELPPDAGAEALLSAARREAVQHLAREDLADRRGMLEERERWMARVAALGRERLAGSGGTAQRRELLATLAREALASLPGDSFQVAVLASDAPLLDDEWRTSVAGPSRRLAVTSENAPASGGCLVSTEDGRVSFDNSLAARARRFEPAWRAELAKAFPS